MKFSFILFIILVSTATGFSQSPKKAEVVSLNGSNIYYEVYGKGEPLILLHGITLSTKYWLPYISDYMNDFEVYVIDLKGHGKSGPLMKGEVPSASAANDVDALMKHLKLKNINAIGYSFGGAVLFKLALLDSGLIKSMISIGACGNWNAREYPDFLEFLSYKNIDKLTWIHEHQPGEEQIKTLLDLFPDESSVTSDKDFKRIQTKVLMVLGDQDPIVPLESAVFARKHLPESYLWVLPDAGHGAHEGKNKIDFVKISKEFFSQSWHK